MAATMVGGPGSGGPKTNAQGVITFKNLAPGDYECIVKVPGEDDFTDMIVVMDSGEEMTDPSEEGTRVVVVEEETEEETDG